MVLVEGYTRTNVAKMHQISPATVRLIINKYIEEGKLF
jgi:transposase